MQANFKLQKSQNINATLKIQKVVPVDICALKTELQEEITNRTNSDNELQNLKADKSNLDVTNNNLSILSDKIDTNTKSISLKADINTVNIIKSELETEISKKQDEGDYATNNRVNQVEAKIPSVPTNISDFNNDAGYITSEYHDPTKQNLISDISDIRTNANKINTKQNILVSGTNIKTINNNNILGSGNIDIGLNKTKLSEFTDDLGSTPVHTHNQYLTEHQSLKGYATENYVKNYHDSTKQDIITDLNTIKNGAEKGATALQSISSSDVTTALGYTPYNSTNPNGYTSNIGTITGITMNGGSKGTSGVVDLGTVVTDVSNKQDTLVSGTNIKTINNQSILGEGNIIIEGKENSVTIDDTTSNTSTVYSSSKIENLLNDKVDKEIGKILSTNDFTTIYKNRLDTLTDDYIKSLIEDGSEVSY